MKPNRQLIDLHTSAAKTYHEAMRGSAGEAYLASRGLVDAIDLFQLGWVSRPVPGHEDRFISTISIPYITQAGVVGMKFRRIDDSLPKYDQMAGQKGHLYNVQSIIDAVDTLLIVEGELDAIAATLAGHPACAVAGVNAWKPYWSRCFDGIQKIIVCTDNDEKSDGSNPGQDLAKRLCDSLPQAVRVSLPAGHDVNSTIETFGVNRFTALVEAV